VLEVRDKETFIIATDEIYRGLSLGEGQMHSLAPATLGVFMASPNGGRMAGATYAVIGVAMAVFLQAFFTWSPEETASIPLLLTAGLIGGIVVNVIWGALLGFVATGIKRAAKR
jgi:hypothetical protein